MEPIKTTSFTPPSVIKLHLLFAHAFTRFGLLVNHLQKAHQLFKGNYHYMIHSYIKYIFIYKLKYDIKLNGVYFTPLFYILLKMRRNFL
jgi:hypothetical protein